MTRRQHTHISDCVCVCVCSCEVQNVLQLFQEAALFNVDSVDPDLQTGLGVLFNLSSDFNKAVEAFTSALSVRPQVTRTYARIVFRTEPKIITVSPPPKPPYIHANTTGSFDDRFVRQNSEASLIQQRFVQHFVLMMREYE